MQEQIDNLQRQLEELKAMYLKDNFEQKQIFRKEVEFVGGAKLGGKVSFFNETPVSQQAAIAAPSTPSGIYVQAEAQSAVNAINSIRTALQNIGIIA